MLCESGAQCPEPETVCTPIEVTEEDLEEARQEIRESAANLVRQLRERILIEDNLESSTATSATYRLGADVLCDGDDDAVPPAAPGADSSDAEARALRVRTSSLTESEGRVPTGARPSSLKAI